MPYLAIAILAAGSSSRMGQAKQLLPYKGKSLLEHSIEAATGTSCSQVFVVVNKLQHLAHEARSDSAYKVLLNVDSDRGISSSISLATREAMADEIVDALLFMNCDQPQIDSVCLERLITAYKQGAIVASRFGDIIGSPAIFDRSFFAELIELQGDRGAKSIMQKHAAVVIEVPMEVAKFDIDTPADYAALSD